MSPIKAVLVAAALVVLILAATFVKNSDWWLIHVRYSTAESVVLEPKPIDCESSTAPQGEKRCHYERYIFVNTDGDKITRVHRTWKRVADNH